MSELSDIPMENLELCKVKFSKVEQFSLIMSNIIENFFFLDHDLLTFVFVCFFLVRECRAVDSSLVKPPS